MLKPLEFYFPSRSVLAVYDWVPFCGIEDKLHVIGTVQRTGLFSRIYKRKTVAVNLFYVLSVGERYSLLHRGPAPQDLLIARSKGGKFSIGIDLLTDIVQVK